MASMENGDPFTSATPAVPNRFPHLEDSSHPFFPTRDQSPSQVKRTLETHLEDTIKRLDLIGGLGEKLIAQKEALADRIKEVGSQSGNELNPELKQRLEDLEKEYKELGRESARVFLTSKSSLGSNAIPNTPQPNTPAAFSGHGVSTPTKANMSRKQRNQSSRTHDIEFAAEIGQSLLVEVRMLRSMLAEREESLKQVELEKSKLEVQAEQLESRIKMLDDSEQRFKEENWNLELILQDMRAAATEAKDTETKLLGQIAAATQEKNVLMKDIYELKQSHAKELDTSSTAHKTIEMELASMKRNMTIHDSERSALKRKVDELTSELDDAAKERATLRHADFNSERDVEHDPLDLAPHDSTPDHSPPPSPTKGTPRHTMLESETLKSSLHHAHRMITNLKSTIHREKTEKAELRRMLQDARDDLEQARGVNTPGIGNSASKRRDKTPMFKKPAPKSLRMGSERKPRTDITMLESPGWEDHYDAIPDPSSESERFETAGESEAFETANENDDDTTDAYRTGAESMNEDSSGEHTETESGMHDDDVFAARTIKPLQLGGNNLTLRPRQIPINPNMSDGSDVDNDDGYALRTPVAVPNAQRLRLKINRGAFRGKSRAVSGGSMFSGMGGADSVENTPPSTSAGIVASPPQQASKSLFAELEGLSDEEEEVPDVEMRDWGMMTDPVPDVIQHVEVPVEVIREVEKRVEVPVEVIREVEKRVEVPVPFEVIKHVEVEKRVEVPVPFEVIKEVEKRVEVPVEVIKEVFVDRPVDREVIKEVQVEKRVEVPVPFEVIKEVEKRVEVPVEVIKEVFVDRPVDREVVVEKRVEVPVEVIKEVEKRVEVPVPFEVIKEVFVDRPVDREVIKEVFVDRPIDREVIVEKRVEVPVEVIKEVEKRVEVPVEVIREVEKRVEVPVPFEVIKEVEKRVEVPVEVIKEVFVDRPVDREVIKEVQVEKHVEVPVPFEVIKEVIKEVEKRVEVPVEVIREVEKRVEVPVQVFVDREVFVDRPVEIIKEVYVDRPVETKRALTSDSAAQHEEPEQSSRGGLLDGAIGAVMGAAASVGLVAATKEREHEPLSFSGVESLHTEPVLPTPMEMRSLAPISALHTEPVESTFPPRVSSLVKNGGLFGLGGILGRNSANSASLSSANGVIATDDTATSGPEHDDGELKLRELSNGGATIRQNRQASQHTSDQEAQTNISFEFFDQLSTDKGKRPSADYNRSQRVRNGSMESARNLSPNDAVRRRSSINSITNRGVAVPPLPANADAKIAAAASAEKRVTTPNEPGSMGPPLAPASASRNAAFRPKVSTESIRNISSPSYNVPRNTAGTPNSARPSSTSSFASELEERFNLGAGPLPEQQGTTDPRMIQAITQTMIGEYLWKYTRNTGRGSLSQNRHKRFFWVHPYTKTLYWSDRDPTSSGLENKSKSVTIEAVKVVTDDNPMPPGLHRKSLIIYTPGRSLKFTAPTGQRHETWYNALSYLLVRDDEINGTTTAAANDSVSNSIHDSDLREFDPQFTRGSSQIPPSLSSYNSRESATTTPSQRNASALSNRGRVTNTGSISRLSNMFRGVSGSFNSRHSRTSGVGSAAHDRADIYDASEVNDSAEDLRANIEREQREAGHLDNVRECCDGKHNVGHLARTSMNGRHSAASHHNHA